MTEGQAFAILSCTLVPMALALIRPSSGMRIIVFGLLLAGMAVFGMAFGLRAFLGTIAGTN
jgi:hypothetical protein